GRFRGESRSPGGGTIQGKRGKAPQERRPAGPQWICWQAGRARLLPSHASFFRIGGTLSRMTSGIGNLSVGICYLCFFARPIAASALTTPSVKLGWSCLFAHKPPQVL